MLCYKETTLILTNICLLLYFPYTKNIPDHEVVDDHKKRASDTEEEEIEVENSRKFNSPILETEQLLYQPDKIVPTLKSSWLNWMELYLDKIKAEVLSDEERKQVMNAINPKYVLRNYMAQLAIEAAEKEDYTLIDELYKLLKKPYDEQPNYEKWFAKRPDWARNKVGCSMLSCSS
jgi:uncharacterized protein YdiU (UPF0061 family)